MSDLDLDDDFLNDSDSTDDDLEMKLLNGRERVRNTNYLLKNKLFSFSNFRRNSTTV